MMLEIILENIESIFTLMLAVLIAVGVFKSEFKRFMQRSARDSVFTMSRSELENILSKSFEINYKLAELTEIRLNNHWEIRTFEKEQTDVQKDRIRYLTSTMDVKLKSKFSDALESSGSAETELERTIHYQQFCNALHVTTTMLRMKLYDMINRNDLIVKPEAEWTVWVKQVKNTLPSETIDHLRSIFLSHTYLNTYPEFISESSIVIAECVEHSLMASREEALLYQNKIKQLSSQIEEAKKEIQLLRDVKATEIIEEFVQGTK